MPLHFKSKKGYDKYVAFLHMHDIPHKHHNKVIIAGHAHKVKRDRKSSRKHHRSRRRR